MNTQLNVDDFMETKVVVLKILDKFGINKKVVTPKHLDLQEFLLFVNSASYVYLILSIAKICSSEKGHIWSTVGLKPSIEDCCSIVFVLRRRG